MIDYSVPYCNNALKCTCMWTSQHMLAHVGWCTTINFILMDDNIETFVNKVSFFAVILCYWKEATRY